jgi:dTDP-4-dehydrorhamnose 3,5-epimerase
VPGDPNPALPPVPTPIDGALVQELDWYTDQRGSLSVLLRDDARELLGDRIGQAYVTTVLPGVVKAWHRHALQWDRMVGLSGRVLLVLVDGRDDSPTRGAVFETVLGERHSRLVLIPPGVWHGFKGISAGEAMVLNLPTRAYDRDAPDEQRAAPDQPPVDGLPPYDWARRDG